MKTKNFNIEELFNQADSYQELLILLTASGGGKVHLNKWLQNEWRMQYTAPYDPEEVGLPRWRKLSNFVRDGVQCREISLKFLWKMIGCT